MKSETLKNQNNYAKEYLKKGDSGKENPETKSERKYLEKDNSEKEKLKKEHNHLKNVNPGKEHLKHVNSGKEQILKGRIYKKNF